MFPFLIGTVRTNLSYILDVVEYQFPFLIGTVRTRNERHAKFFVNEFPFLIGTVRTLSAMDDSTSQRSFHSS